MAEACVLEWVPDSLYNTAISTMVAHYSKVKREVKTLPESVQFDIYYKLYNKCRLCDLGTEFSDLDVFAKVLRVKDKRHLLHHCFQAVMDHGQHLSANLADTFCQHCSIMQLDMPQVHKDKTLQLGLSLAGFLSDAGWYSDSEKTLVACLRICEEKDDTTHLLQALECCIRLLHVRNANCRFSEAQRTWNDSQRLVKQLEENGHIVNKARLYSEYCAIVFAKSQYDEAFQYCCLALKEISSSLPDRTIVDVFRQSAKACVVKREFKRAELLIKFAVQFAREQFDSKHHKYSDALLDYGYYLLNVDSICQAVQVYQAALDIRMSLFGGNNLHVAIAHEDLAYSSYVHEYSTGKFQDARDHAEKAIEIITHMLPPDHLLLASSKRVKALILEEIAIDSHNKEVEEQLLQEAQDLHLASLALAQKAFGENNVQTAKHYGNLGRLYQSMHRYTEAEEMHLKAIAIKERLLGPEDYEVALSVGHLASLYNYDMSKFEEAEKLYLRSIAIGRKLFGPGYSGLEYDYRGLLKLYQNVGNVQKAMEFGVVLHEWNHIRDHNNAEEQKPLELDDFPSSIEVVQRFFTINEHPGTQPSSSSPSS